MHAIFLSDPRNSSLTDALHDVENSSLSAARHIKGAIRLAVMLEKIVKGLVFIWGLHALHNSRMPIAVWVAPGIYVSDRIYGWAGAMRFIGEPARDMKKNRGLVAKDTQASRLCEPPNTRASATM